LAVVGFATMDVYRAWEIVISENPCDNFFINAEFKFYLEAQNILPGTIEILKKRFPEALLIIVFQASVIFLGGQVRAMFNEKGELATSINDLASFAMAICMGCLAVIWIMLELGFLTTICKEGTAQQQPIRLVIEGKYFFWRSVRFRLVLSVALVLIAQMIMVTGNVAFFRLEDLGEIPKLFETACIILALLFLARQFLLTQAIMIVEDCNVIPAVIISLRFKLSLIKMLIVAFIAAKAFELLTPMAFKEEGTLGFEVNIFSMIYSFAVSAFMFIITVAALRLVVMEKQSQPQSNTEVSESE